MSNHKTVSLDLRRIVEGEVLDREWQRVMYAADASIYEVLPICIVVPKTEQDVVKTVRYAYENRIPVTARGGGTSLAGQAIGNGIVIDFSKYMNRVLKVAPDEGYVIVEPGVNKSELDTILKGFSKFLPPDPSSSDFCTIGGMVANNAGGAHTVKYGSMIDYIASLKIVLCNGEVVETRPIKMGGEEWRRLVEKDTLESKIYTELGRIVQTNLELIRDAAPSVRKNSSGYQMDMLLQDDIFDLGKILVASEGTLAVILQAKLRILDIPQFRGTAMLQFDSLEKMGLTVTKILDLKPSAVELLDNHVITLAANGHPEVRKEVPEYVKALLLVEFDGVSRDEVEEGLKKLETVLSENSGMALRVVYAHTPDEAERFWSIRKKSLPYIMKMRRGGRRPTPFIEDTVVEPERLAEYLQSLYSIYRKYGVEGVVYGHAGDGNLHTRPLLDLKNKNDVDTMVKIADEVFQLVKDYRGSMTGEHGDGLVRTGYVESMFGEDVFRLFSQVKSVFDPLNIMNPGKKISTSSLMRSNLRYGPSYKRRTYETALNWGIKGSRAIQRLTNYPDELTYEDEVELCHGCGTCRAVSSGRMCPVFRAYRMEVDSCRGRMNILRWLLKLDGLPVDFEVTDEYRDIVYNHCVQCRMCQVDCPSNVNVGKIMAEAMARYSLHREGPKGYRYFAKIDSYGALCSRLAPLSNRLFESNLFRQILEWYTGIDSRRRFPKFSRRTFAQLFRKYEDSLNTGAPKSLVFFYDTYIDYINPQLGLAVVKILAKNGYKILIPPQKSSGLPAILEGSLDIGRRIVEYNVTHLSPYAEKGFPIITFSPSAGLALKMEYLNVLDTSASRLVAESTFDIHEFLYLLHRGGELVEDFNPVRRDVYLHLHCHSIVQGVEDYVTKLLSLIPELKFKVLEKGCCGIGGAFGFIKGNYEKSMKIGEPLFAAIRSTDRQVYSTGESCALQMEAGSGRKIGLTMDLIKEAYGF